MTASESDMKTIPCSDSSFLKVVAIETESNTASTATLARRFCSPSGIPSFANVARRSGSTSSSDAFLGFSLGAE